MIHEKPIRTETLRLTFPEKAKKVSEKYNDLFSIKPVKSHVDIIKDDKGRSYAFVSIDFFDDTYGDASISFETGIFMGMYLIF